MEFNKLCKKIKNGSMAIITTLTVMSPSVVLADHTDEGFYVCNKTLSTRTFSLIDSDDGNFQVFTVSPTQCTQFWNYEKIVFFPDDRNILSYKEYSLNENYNYSFEYNSGGYVEVYKNIDLEQTL